MSNINNKNIKLGNKYYECYKLGVIILVIATFCMCVMVFALSEPVSGESRNEDDLVLYLPMDEGSGDTVYDESDNNIDGDNNGAKWVEGIDEKGLRFDGENDWIDLGDALDDTFTNDIFTITAWVKPRDTSGEIAYQIIAKSDGTSLNSDDMLSFKFQDDTLGFYVKDDSDNTVGVEYYSTDFENHWVFVTGVYDRSRTNLSLYVDGILVDYTFANVDIVNEPNVRLVIGTTYGEEYPATSRFFNGIIDEVRIYNIALSDEEIDNLYQEYSKPQKLQGFWSFDGGVGDIAYDYSSNWYDGDIKGAKWISGINNTALDFDGDNDWVDLGDVLDDTFTNDIFTITVWAKPRKTSGGNTYQIIAKSDGTSLNTDDMFSLKFQDDTLGFYVKDDSDNTVGVEYYSTDFENHWVFVTGVYDRSRTNISLYVDGILKDYTYADVDIVNEPNVRLAIGTTYGEEYPATYRFFNGIIDEVRIYNIALSDGEIKAYYESLLVENTPPTINNVQILPSEPKTIDDLSVNYNYNDDEGDLEDGTIYEWYKDEGSGFVSAGLTTDIISHGNTNKGEFWKCEVTPKDGEDFGPSVFSNEVKILNSVPIIDNVFISPQNPLTTDDLAVSYVFSDNDDDLEDGTIYEWYKDEGSGFVSTGLNTDVISHENTNKGEFWKCEVTPQDGEEFGDTVASNIIKIKSSNSMDPIAYWSFDEGNGDTAYDNTENSNDGDIKGAEWNSGVNNTALDFDGDNDWVDLGDVLDDTFTNDIFTISAWVKPEKTSGEYAYQIIAKSDGTSLNSDDMLSFKFQDDTLAFYVKDDSDNTVGVQYYSADFEGHWLFVTGVYDRSRTNLSLYADGILTDYTSADIDIVNEPNVRLAIGTTYGDEYPATYRFFKGIIDEVMIYDIALSADKIKTLYESLLPENTPPIVNNVRISPSEPMSTDDLSVNYNYHDDDRDLEDGTIYEWFKDEGSGFVSTGLNTDVISHENTKNGEFWKCEVTPKDGEEFGETVTSNVIEIKNSNSMDPIAYWTFDEENGDTAYDDTENDNDGIIREAEWIAGVKNTALTFDGDNDWVDFGDVLDDTFTNDIFTITAWVKPRETSGEFAYQIIAKSDGTSLNSDDMLSFKFQDDTLGFYVKDDSDNTVGVEYYSTDFENHWVFVTGVYDRSRTNISLYVDGILKDYTYADVDIVNEPNVRLAIGTTYGEEYPATRRFFNGIIDEVKIYDIALSTEKIKAIYENYLIENTPPTVKNVQISPSEVTSLDDLSINYDYHDEDGDLEGGTVYEWYKDEGNGFVSTDLITDVISHENTKKGEFWKCKVTPKDGWEFGESFLSNSIKINNSPPEAIIASPKNNAEYLLGSEITFDGSKSIDYDNDILSFKWTIEAIIIGSEATFNKILEEGTHEIILFVDDNDGGTSTTYIEITVMDNIQSPDLSIDENHILIISNPIKDKTIKIYANIRNIGEIKGSATIKFYDNEISEENLISMHNKISVQAQDNHTVVAEWTPDTKGSHSIYVVIENCEPDDINTKNNQAVKTVDVTTENSEGGFIPGFGTPLVTISICLGALVAFFRRRNGNR